MMLPTRPSVLGAAPLFALLLLASLGCNDSDDEQHHDVSDAAVSANDVLHTAHDAEVSADDVLHGDTSPELDSGPDSVDDPPPFDPTDLEGLSLFFDADHDESVMMSSQGRVHMWRDLSGGDNHAYQAIDRHMPHYRTEAQAGRAVLDFDRSFLTTSEAVQLRATGQGYTIFAVASNTVADDVGGSEGRGGILLGNYRRPHSNFSIELHHNRRLRHWWDRREEYADPADENRGDATFDAPRPERDTFAILNFFLDASEHTVGAAVDGEFADSLPDDGFVYEVQRPLRIGADYREQNLPTSWKGSIGELLVYERLLNDAEMAEIHQYLSQKWEIPLTN